MICLIIEEHGLRHLYTIAFCFLLASGCTSTYQTPKVAVPKQWPHDHMHTTRSNVPLKKMQWWQQYHQPTLNRLIKRAVLQNNDIHQAIANIEYAQAQLQEIKLNWLPNATLMAGVSQFPILANPGGFGLIAPLYVINIFQQYQQQKSGQQLLEASLYAKDCAILMVISTVATSYFTLLAEQEAAFLYEQLIKDEAHHLALTKSQYYAGLISDDDVQRIESQLEQTKALLDITLHNIVVSKNALHFLLNENPGEFKIQESFQSIHDSALMPNLIPVNVLHQRPDIRQQEAVLKSQYANVGASIANLLPSITLGAYLGAGTTSHGPMNVIESYASIPINLPFYAQIKVNQAQFKNSYIQYIKTIRMALRDIDNDLSKYHAKQKELAHVKRALAHSSALCNLAAKRLDYGISDDIEVTACMVQVDELKIKLNQSKLQTMLSLVQLYQDLAGGYHAV